MINPAFIGLTHHSSWIYPHPSDLSELQANAAVGTFLRGLFGCKLVVREQQGSIVMNFPDHMITGSLSMFHDFKIFEL